MFLRNAFSVNRAAIDSSADDLCKEIALYVGTKHALIRELEHVVIMCTVNDLTQHKRSWLITRRWFTLEMLH